jgi:aldehyde:ferredoxin oxidoreductase
MAWTNNVLRVNLTTQTCTTEPLNKNWAESYLGVRGLGTKYLWENMDPKADPLGPDNVLIFATGPLTGTMAPTSGRYAVLCKGPLTNAIACSNSGGKFGAELKFAGYDLMLIEGRSENPVYLSIVNDKVEILPADEIWGTSVWHTEEWIKKQHNDPLVRIASCGPAGENQCRFAAVINDLHRAAGRSGVGAVMGSKNLKAIAARGTKGVTADNPEKFMDAVRTSHSILADNDGRKELTELGTNAMIDMMQEFGGLPTRNFDAVQFEGTDKINPDAMFRVSEDGHRNMVTNKACFGCTIACGRIAHVDKKHETVKDKPEYQVPSGGLEYETAFAFGPMVGVDDIDALTYAGFLTNEYGYDPISFGGTLAAAMELYEKGVITDADTDGVALNFGNAEALTIMAEKTGKGEGFGKILALGSKLLCEKYGHPDVAMHVKGQEFAGYDSRALQGMGLGFATSNRGACHLKHIMFDEDMEDISGNGKSKPCKDSQDRVAAVDSTGLCLFILDGGIENSHFVDLLDADLPGEWTEERMLETGERVWNLERRFNLAAGLSMKDDTLPKRLLETPAPTGSAKGKVNELSQMLPEYYEARGWTEDGQLTNELIERLGL